MFTLVSPTYEYVYINSILLVTTAFECVSQQTGYVHTIHYPGKCHSAPDNLHNLTTLNRGRCLRAHDHKSDVFIITDY